jgi:hypothetical protein
MQNKYFVYFIYECVPEGVVSAIKIGESKNPSRRLRNLQTGNKYLLKIYKTITCPDKKYAKQLEGSLHQRYLKKLSGGEWFNITFQEVDYICTKHEQLLQSGIPLQYFTDILEQDEREKQTPKPKPLPKIPDIPFLPV